MNSTTSGMQRGGWCMGLLGLTLLALVARLVQINTMMAPRLIAVAERQRTGVRVVPARRGSIFDRRGRLLAGSRLRPSLYADPSLIDNPADTARKLGDMLGVDPGIIENEIRSAGAPRFCWLQRLVSREEADAVRRMGLAGVGAVDEFARYWPMGSLAAHVLGYVGSDGQGLAGVERAGQEHLRARPGRQGVLRDARRRVLATWGSRQAPRDGGHLVLTIDAVIQEIVEHRLAESLDRYEAQSGLVIVMAPRTGDVLAMACAPTFDPPHPMRVDSDRRRNRTVTDPVEPGSVFKPFIMAAALDAGLVDPDEQFDCHNGEYTFGHRVMHDTSPHGILTPKGILVHSSNIGMGQVGTRMGNKRLRRCLSDFGFDERTQLGLAGESRGLVPGLGRWNDYSTTSVPIGQEIAVTPIQLITAFCALVNDGVLLRPRIVKARLDATGGVVAEFDEPEVVRRVVSVEVARFITREALPAVVARYHPRLDPVPYDMLGKTGTAQVPYRDRKGYEPGAYLSSFVCAGPVADPQVVVLVMISRPNPVLGYYGSKVAAPAGRDIIRAVLDYMHAPATARLATRDAGP